MIKAFALLGLSAFAFQAQAQDCVDFPDPAMVFTPLELCAYGDVSQNVVEFEPGLIDVYRMDNYKPASPGEISHGDMGDTYFSGAKHLEEGVIGLKKPKDIVADVIVKGQEDGVHEGLSQFLYMAVEREYPFGLITQAIWQDTGRPEGNLYQPIYNHREGITHLAAIKNQSYIPSKTFPGNLAIEVCNHSAADTEADPHCDDLKMAAIKNDQMDAFLFVATIYEIEGEGFFVNGAVDFRKDDAWTQNTIFVEHPMQAGKYLLNSWGTPLASGVIAQISKQTGLRGAELKDYIIGLTTKTHAKQIQLIDEKGEIVKDELVPIKFLPLDAVPNT